MRKGRPGPIKIEKTTFFNNKEIDYEEVEGFDVTIEIELVILLTIKSEISPK